LAAALTAQQIEGCRRAGYLSPIPILSLDEVARYRCAMEELEERAAGLTVVQPQLHYAWAYELATHPRLLDTIGCVLGPDILVHSASIFSKGPRTRAHVDWHQDAAHLGQDVPAAVSAWVALTPSTAENGCLRVLPGSHSQGVMPYDHDPGPDKMLLSGLRVSEEIDETGAVDIVLGPGEAALLHINTLHGSSANLSPNKRIGFAIRYVAPYVRQSLSNNPVFVARGRDVHSHYPVRLEPPTATVEEGLPAQLAFSIAFTKQRTAELASLRDRREKQ
jgi:non-heme Fe2+,alpha-ketoglutarate-dependent halogenase